MQKLCVWAVQEAIYRFYLPYSVVIPCGIPRYFHKLARKTLGVR